MCPACLTTLALVAAGTGSAGGLAAVAARKLWKRPPAKAPVAPPSVDKPVKKEELR